jgi:hypothetical protein
MMVISSLFCVVLVPLVYAAVNRTAEQQRRFDEIANMTESDRRQLEHNFEAFQQLPPEKQEQYRQLHAQLHGTEFNDLQTVLLDYHEFLRSLDPVDRSEIERQKEFWGKIHAIENVVNRLNDESQRYQELLQQSFANNQRSSNWGEGRWRPIPPLSPEEIESLSRVLASHQNLTVAQKTQLEPLRGVDRLAQILSIVLVASGGSETKPFFSSQLTNELIAALSEERVKYFHQSKERREEEERKFEIQVKAREADPDRPPWFLRRTLEEHHEMILIGTCIYTFNRALNDSAPSPEKMPAFLKELPPDVRDDFLNEDAGRLYENLVKEYYSRTPTTLSKATKIIQEQAKKRTPKYPPPGRSGPGRSGGGTGRPGDDRERPGEAPRERRDGESDREPRGAGFPDRSRNDRNERREEPKSIESSTQSSED